LLRPWTDAGSTLASARRGFDDLALRLGDALRSACGAAPALAVAGGVGAIHRAEAVAATRVAAATDVDVNRFVVALFEQEGSSLVRLARLFVDDRNAAEDLVQEAFIRLARSAGRIEDRAKAAAYLRSIVLNLARDQNRRGLVSLRHQLPFDDRRASLEDEITLRDDQRRVIEALRDLPHRQRDCLVLRYYHELGIADIAVTLSISPNSVKTHLQRGLAALERNLAASGEEM
jgi:RNA polymerase sigma factor (sigma-70 family)